MFFHFRYIYGGKISLEEYDDLDIIKILVAAYELSLHELVIYIQSFLTKNKTNWMELNFNLIYQTSFENDSFLELQEYCTDLISKDPDKILKSLDFSTTPEKLIVSLIQNDNLQMREVQVWEHVLKWGLAKNPELSSDPSSFSKNDFNSLKNTLQQCIPFIKFYNLTSKEFSDKVLPYKKVLPKGLYNELLTAFLNLHPNSKPSGTSEPQMAKKINIEDNGTKELFESYMKAAEEGNLDAQTNVGFHYQNGIGIPKDENKAFEWYMKAAKGGNVDAQNNLGDCYKNGIGVPKNDKESFEWYIKAAEGGSLNAQTNIGHYYLNEIGVEVDLNKSIYWYSKAAEGGCEIAQYHLGCFYESGVGVEKDGVKAFKYFKKSAESGYLDSQVKLSFFYNCGYGTKKDIKNSIYWLEKAAKNGSGLAKYNLAECYELGNGVSKDENKAFEFYKESAENGYVGAKFILGYYYVSGIGTEVNKEKGFELFNEAAGRNVPNNLEENLISDMDKVNYWYHKTAENDNKFALYKLGELYQLGKGVSQNERRAFEFYKKSAEKGFIDAYYKLGHIYNHGYEIDIDKEKAFDSFKVAAEGGNIDAQLAIASLYARGEGTEKDMERAIYWYKLVNEVLEEEYLDVLLKILTIDQ
jgi:TPR repeat protein